MGKKPYIFPWVVSGAHGRSIPNQKKGPCGIFSPKAAFNAERTDLDPPFFLVKGWLVYEGWRLGCPAGT